MALGIHGKQLRDSTIEREKLAFAITGTPIVQYNGDYDLTPLNTIGDDSPTGIFPSEDPYEDTGFYVMVNGQIVELGDGVKTKDCYFTSDGGTTADLIKNIGTQSHLYWNGSISTYDLSTDDSVSFQYEITSPLIIAPVVAGLTGPQGPAGPGATPGGTANSVQFNDGFGNFSGSEDLTWNQSTKILTTDKIKLTSSIIQNSTSDNIISIGSGATATTVFSGSLDTIGTSKFRSLTNNRVMDMLVTPDGTGLTFISVNTILGFITTDLNSNAAIGGFRIVDGGIEHLVLNLNNLGNFCRLTSPTKRLVIGNSAGTMTQDPTTGYMHIGGTIPTSVTGAMLELGGISGFSSPYPAHLKLSPTGFEPTSPSGGDIWYVSGDILKLYNGTTTRTFVFGSGVSDRVPIWTSGNTISSTSDFTYSTSLNVLNVLKIRLNSNAIQNSSGSDILTLSGSDVFILGNLKLTGNNILNSAGSTVMTMSGTNLVVAGNLQINGNNILNSTGNTAITMNTGATPITKFSGHIQANSNIILNSDGFIMLSTISGSSPVLTGLVFKPSARMEIYVASTGGSTQAVPSTLGSSFWATPIKDTTGAWNSSGFFTAPRSGMYLLTANILFRDFSGTSESNSSLGWFFSIDDESSPVNGRRFEPAVGASYTGNNINFSVPGSIIVSLTAGQTVRIKTTKTNITSVSAWNTSSYDHFSAVEL